VRRHIPLLVLTLLLSTFPVSAQPSTVITVAIDRGMGDLLNEDLLFAPFYEQNPDVQVVFVPVPTFETLTNEFILDSPESHLDDIATYAQSADIVHLNSRILINGGTRAGYFLDLAPLADSDATLSEADYFPAAWNAFRWDGGLWGLPRNVRLEFLAYNPEVFSEVGLNMPTNNWTTEEFLTTVETLYDSGYSTAGHIGLGGGTDLVLRALYGRSFSTEGQPDFTNPTIAGLIEQLSVMRDREFFGTPVPRTSDIIPLSITETMRLVHSREEEPKVPVAFPNNVISATSEGFAISAGTEHPELAYQVARFLMDDATFNQWSVYDAPANRSLVDVTYGNVFSDQLDDSTRAFLQAALETALPASEIQFSAFVSHALFSEYGYEGDVQTLLEEVQGESVAALQTAENRRGTYTLVIPTPVLPPPLAEGEIELRVAIGGSSFVYDDALIESALQAFVETDAVVGRVEHSLNMPRNQLDCFVQTSIYVLNMEVQPISPYAEADTAFDENDYLRGTLNGFRSNNGLTGLPVAITVNGIRYDPNTVQNVGNWDTAEFEGVLTALKAEGKMPLQPEGAGEVTPYLVLAASYGGLPVRYMEDGSLVFDFISEESVFALQEALDLAREGLIGYTGVDGEFDFSSGFPVMFFGTFGTSQTLTGLPEAPQLPVFDAPYPTGIRYTPVSYNVDGFYIGTNSPNPEACYRLYRFLMDERPELLQAIPALRSVLQSEAYANAVGGSAAGANLLFTKQLDQPNTVIFPTDFYNGDYVANPIRYRWIAEAFDHYVLEGADLKAELTALQTQLDTFDQCLAGKLEPEIVNHCVELP
jgi:ABC-type glycerol-3-phosphate transport system substrate-binding protein